MTLLEILQTVNEVLTASLQWGIMLCDAHPMLGIGGLLTLGCTGITLIKKLARG